jgi:hypothetical protein
MKQLVETDHLCLAGFWSDCPAAEATPADF